MDFDKVVLRRTACILLEIDAALLPLASVCHQLQLFCAESSEQNVVVKGFAEARGSRTDPDLSLFTTHYSSRKQPNLACEWALVKILSNPCDRVEVVERVALRSLDFQFGCCWIGLD